MIDTLNLDQLRVLVAIDDDGSFSAAARKLLRAQSAISNAVVNLESALGVTLFDRSGWKPKLTEHGRALVGEARELLAHTDRFKARALGLAQGLEAELSIVVDVMFPMARLVELVSNFQKRYPSVELRLCTAVLGGVPARVLSGEYAMGIQGSLPDIAPALASIAIDEIALVPTASPKHPLAALQRIANETLREHTQIVLTDHSGQTEGRTFSVFGRRRVLTADLGSKQAMLRAALGWGFMPHSVVADDLASRRLIELDLAERRPRSRRIPLFLVHQRSKPLGPAARWVSEYLSAKRLGPSGSGPFF